MGNDSKAWGILGELIYEFGLQMKALFVTLERNEMDALMRVNKKCLVYKEKEEDPVYLLGNEELECNIWKWTLLYIWFEKLTCS